MSNVDKANFLFKQTLSEFKKSNPKKSLVTIIKENKDILVF